MPLAEWFKKKFNGDVTGVGKSPLRKRFSKFRQSRISEKSKAGAKKIQDVEGVKPDTKIRLMGMRRP